MDLEELCKLSSSGTFATLVLHKDVDVKLSAIDFHTVIILNSPVGLLIALEFHNQNAKNEWGI